MPGWTYVGPITPHEARAVIFGRTALERHLIFKVADCVERFTGERPNHGKRWLPKMIATIAIVDREIGRGSIQGALRPPRHGVPPAR